MDLKDFLVCSNALNIQFSRKLITQSYGNRFRDYMNKWQLFFTFTSNENNLIYVFITQTLEGLIKHRFCSSWVDHVFLRVGASVISQISKVFLQYNTMLL